MASKHLTKKVTTTSELPDPIIVNVLVHLPIKEAARTSLVSRRWRKLWTFLPSLNFDTYSTFCPPIPFDGEKIIINCGEWVAGLRIETPKFINCVNQALKSHNHSQTICDFIVRFDLSKKYSSDIDSWIQFAMNRRVQRLHLEFSRSWVQFAGLRDGYPFPSSALAFDSLTDVCLVFVNVSGQVLEQFLYNCRNLERLRVSCSDYLTSLKVPGLPLKLKILELHVCHNLHTIDILAPNLQAFKYFGNQIDVQLFKNFPRLVRASFGGNFCSIVINSFRQLSSHFTQLHTLTIFLFNYDPPTFELLNLGVLNTVKQLEIATCITTPFTLRIVKIIISIVKAFPHLNRFLLQKGSHVEDIFWKDDIHSDDILESDTSSREPREGPHKFLKLVEFLGFSGTENEVELATYFIENAGSMETLVFDSRFYLQPSRREATIYFEVQKAQQVATECAKQLGPKLNPFARILVL